MSKRLLRKSLFYIIAILLGIIFNTYYSHQSDSGPTLSDKKYAVTAAPSGTQLSAYSQIAVVAKVSDGDTIELSTGEKVRYIGIDTPELHHPTKPVGCFAKEAFEKNKQLVEGKTIRLEKDVSQTDRYGRLLRYVYLQDGQSEIFVNKLLVAEGYAYSVTFPPDVAHEQEFRALQQQAQQEKKGMWSACN